MVLSEVFGPDCAEDANAFSIWLLLLDGEGNHRRLLRLGQDRPMPVSCTLSRRQKTLKVSHSLPGIRWSVARPVRRRRDPGRE